jgi:sugar-specific transcriptional regulator TrmB
MLPPNLTDFGFTATETAVYFALAELGPSSGYAVAQALSIARANAYQALHGLVAKGAALRLGGQPGRFRALQPMALFTSIAERTARQLDTLEVKMLRQPAAGAPTTTPILGRRALLDVALRTAARFEGKTTCLAPAPVLAALAPAWHRRAAANWPTELWLLDDGVDGMDLALPSPPRRLRAAVAQAYFPDRILALTTPDAALLAVVGVADQASGFWTSDPVLGGAIRATVDHLTTASQ